MREEFINDGVFDWMQRDGMTISTTPKTPGAGKMAEDKASSNGTGVSEVGKDDVGNANGRGGAESSAKPMQGNPGSSRDPEKKNSGVMHSASTHAVRGNSGLRGSFLEGERGAAPDVPAPIKEQPAEGAGSKPGARDSEDQNAEITGKKDPPIFGKRKPKKSKSFLPGLCCKGIDEKSQ